MLFTRHREPLAGRGRRDDMLLARCFRATGLRIRSSTVAFTLHREPTEQVAMRCLAANVMLMAAILGVRFGSASEQSGGELSLTLRIHDYSRVPSDSLSRATAIVTRTYEKIGVRTEWMGVARPAEQRDASRRRDETPPRPAAQLTIIILTPEMAARAHVAEQVLGYAAVPDEGMGSIAFAVYERVRAAARKIPANEAELLGFVMAHEIGHLVLPRGSQPDTTGLMKNHWQVRDLQRLDLLTLDFSAEQARQVRDTIENASLKSSGRAGR